MPRKNQTADNLPLAIGDRLLQWGRCVRHGRIRQRITVRDLANRIQISTQTLARLEAGDPTVQTGSYLTRTMGVGLAGRHRAGTRPCAVANSAGNPPRAPEVP